MTVDRILSIRIDVTDEDIRVGVPGDSRRCPVARAFQRALEDTLGMPRTIYSLNRDHAPRWIIRWMLNFDAGRESAPISFVAIEPFLYKGDVIPWDRTAA